MFLHQLRHLLLMFGLLLILVCLQNLQGKMSSLTTASDEYCSVKSHILKEIVVKVGFNCILTLFFKIINQIIEFGNESHWYP